VPQRRNHCPKKNNPAPGRKVFLAPRDYMSAGLAQSLARKSEVIEYVMSLQNK
jgi:hypothetical protein